MHITLFGATGLTGRELITQALARGHRVMASAREPGKLDVTHDALTIARGDVLDPESIASALQGADAVIIAIGGGGLNDGRTRSEGTANILAAMRHAGVERLIVISTIGVGDSINQLSPEGQAFVQRVIRVAVEDHARQEALVQASDTAWTIARPGGLTQGPLTTTYIADPHGQSPVGQIARADLAHFALGALHDDTTIHQIVALTGAPTP